MPTTLFTVQLRTERDVVRARQRTREIAAELGLENSEQIRLATAVSEMARNAFRYARQGRVTFNFRRETPQALEIIIADSGPGIAELDVVLEGRYQSKTGMGIGITGTRRLMDHFDIQTSPSGTRVELGKNMPPTASLVTNRDLDEITKKISLLEPESPYEEIERQNQELLKTMQELRNRQEDLAILNRELEDTNRGVVALYAELDDRADYLRRTSDLKQAFFSNVSHEFRTPLNAIISLSRMLLDRIDGELTQEQVKQVAFIREAATTLSDMVNDLLDLAKVEAGKVKVKVRSFEVAEIFSALKGMLKPLLADNSSLDLVFDDASEIAAMRTDDGKVSQILRNFISNAVKFTPLGEVRVSASEDGQGNVVFSVKDTGIGIAPEHHDDIFQEFTQIENPLQEKFHGTGLGLPLCRNLAQLLGGSVWVESEVGSGATFFASIPALFGGKVDMEAVGGEIEFNRLSVLLVEDNADAFAELEPAFRKSEFQLVHVDTLDRATRWLARNTPVAVVSNLYLNGSAIGNFFKLYKEGRKDQERPPVIMVSFYDDAAQAKLNGADAFFKKPYETDLLLRELRRLTERPEPKRLLLVDDNDISHYILRQVLDRPWLTLLRANDGLEALEMIAQERPDAVVLDLVMPGMDGLQVLEKVRAQDATRDLPVIIFTSKAVSAEEREQMRRLNVPLVNKSEVNSSMAPSGILDLLARMGISEPISA